MTHQQQQMMSDFSSWKGASVSKRNSHAISKIELKEKKTQQNVFVEMKRLAVFPDCQCNQLMQIASRKKRMNMFEPGKTKHQRVRPLARVCLYSLLDVILSFPLGAANNVSRFLFHTIHNKQTNNKWHIHSSSLYDSQKPRPHCWGSMKI